MHEIAGRTAHCAAIAHIVVKSAVGAGEETCADLPGPKSYEASLEVADAHLWEQARAEEIASLVASKTWEVIRRGPNTHLLRRKWVMKKKKDGNGAVGHYKARLVARGDEKVLERDYNLTFSALLDMTSGKVILGVARS